MHAQSSAGDSPDDSPDDPPGYRRGDSAGVPWQGRQLPRSPYPDDDGRPDPALRAALSRFAAGVADHSEVVQAIAGARLFASVVPHPQSASDLAVITLTVADGRRALPVFTSAASLAAWRPDARPVPVSGPRAAQAAIAEGCDLLELDSSGPVRHVVGRPAVLALAQGRPWTPSYTNPVVAEQISALAASLGLSARCEPGRAAELRIVLSLPGGLDEPAVNGLIARMSEALGANRLVVDGVDSVELHLRPA